MGVLLDEFGVISPEDSFWTVIDRKTDIADVAMAAYVAKCEASMVNLFDHQADEKTRDASKISFCLSDSLGATSAGQDAAISAWAMKAIDYQTDQINDRFTTVVCPTLAVAAGALVGVVG